LKSNNDNSTLLKLHMVIKLHFQKSYICEEMSGLKLTSMRRHEKI